jgi:murein L,D-transpeptidase YafK
MRKSRPLKTIIFLGVLIAIAGAALFAFWPQIYSLIESELIYREKAKRWGLASTGQALPGTPDLKNLPGRLAEHNMSLGAPVFLRIFKREFELEVWLKRNGRFERFATYPVCMWSGALGPKLRQGDRQAPEGFYTVDKAQLNPASKYHRSFNLGFPNAYDRALGRTGSLLMVHGDCRSIGCYAMTDPVIDEIWTLVTSALDAGQKRFQVQVFPYRMTDANMARHTHEPDALFWRQLKAGYDAFEDGHVPPDVSVCRNEYAVRPGSGDKDGSTPITAACPPGRAGS